MNKADVMKKTRRFADGAAANGATQEAAARTALNRMRNKAQHLASEAQSRARGEVARRRTEAAATLESLAGALRPEVGAPSAKDRRRVMAAVGGSSLALAAMLGLGVALGIMLSRQLNKRSPQAAGAKASGRRPDPAALAQGAGPALDPYEVDREGLAGSTH